MKFLFRRPMIWSEVAIFLLKNEGSAFKKQNIQQWYPSLVADKKENGIEAFTNKYSYHIFLKNLCLRIAIPLIVIQLKNICTH